MNRIETQHVTQLPPAWQLADEVRAGQRSATELLEQCLDTVAALDPHLGAFVHLDADGARKQAAALDAAIARGEDPGPLAGLPLAVKDLDECAGMPLREGSALFRDAGPSLTDNVHVARLRAAGAIPFGKTTTPEFGMLGQTATRAYGITRNPWDVTRTPGGSSGGSAAAVAAGMAPIATAGDGGGSIRIPAAYCGLPGLKPSHGRIPMANNGDWAVYGCMAITVRDIARHLDVAGGPDDIDQQSLPAPTLRYETAIEELDLSGLRVAWSPDIGHAPVDEEVLAAAEAARDALVAKAGLRLVERPFAPPNAGVAWFVLAGDSARRRMAHLGVWPDRVEELEPNTQMALRLLDLLGPEHVYRAHERRRETVRAFAELWSDVDVLLTPGTAVTAPGAAAAGPTTIAGRDAGLTGPSPFTAMVNSAWVPAGVVPTGLHSDGLPMSLQIVGRRQQDEVVLRLMRILEQERPWVARPAQVNGTVPADEDQSLLAPGGALPEPLLRAFFEWALDLNHPAHEMTPEIMSTFQELMEAAQS